LTARLLMMSCCRGGRRDWDTCRRIPSSSTAPCARTWYGTAPAGAFRVRVAVGAETSPMTKVAHTAISHATVEADAAKLPPAAAVGVETLPPAIKAPSAMRRYGRCWSRSMLRTW